MTQQSIQQAECPIHGVKLSGPFAACPKKGCEYERQRAQAMQNAFPQGYTPEYLNSLRNAAIENLEHAPNPPSVRQWPKLSRWDRVRLWFRRWSL